MAQALDISKLYRRIFEKAQTPVNEVIIADRDIRQTNFEFISKPLKRITQSSQIYKILPSATT
jgi:hypothetical protein